MPMDDGFLSRWEAEQAKKKLNASRSLKKLCTKLAAMGIATVVCEYDGSGDSGSIDDTIATAVGGGVHVLDDAITEEIESRVYDLLPSGWEINDGSSGSFTLDVASLKGSMEHHERIMEIDCSHENFDFSATED